MKTKDILLTIAGVIILLLWTLPLGMPIFGKLFGTGGLCLIFFFLSKIFVKEEVKEEKKEPQAGGDWFRTNDNDAANIQ